MKQTIKTLSNYEYNALCKILRKTRMDCWCDLRQDKYGTDYVYDLEEGKRIALRTGLRDVAEGICDQENFDSCDLTWTEKVTVRNLFDKLGITTLSDCIDFKLPEFEGMARDDFLKMVASVQCDKQKNGDDYFVDGFIYQFGTQNTCFSVIPVEPLYNHKKPSLDDKIQSASEQAEGKQTDFDVKGKDGATR